VDQHHDRQLSGALSDPKLAGDGRSVAVGVAGQELLVRQGQRRDGMKLDPRRDLLCVLRLRRNGRCKHEKNSRTECPHPAPSHFVPASTRS